jgi:hypothetical protein
MTKQGGPAIGLLLLILFFSGSNAWAQPYFDPFTLTGWHIPQGGSDVPAAESYLNISAAIPIKLSDRKLLLVRGYYEQRHLDYDDVEESVRLYGMGIPVTFLMTSKDSSFKHAFTVIGRSNATEFRISSNTLQFAAAYLATFKLKPNLSVQFGMYYSKEFFSDFFLPLAGIDWRISPKVNLFGVFPNAMRLEYTPFKNVYVGADFKSVLNSYRVQSPGNVYWKVVDNHLGLFAEYAFLGKFVVYAGSGTSFLRRIKTRNFGSAAYPEVTGDQYYLKAGMYFRIRN